MHTGFYYFYTMRQLDLFGMPEEPKKKEEEQPTALVVQMPADNDAEEEVVEEEEEATETHTLYIAPDDLKEESDEISAEEVKPAVEEKSDAYKLKRPTVIFQNENIGVKIKTKEPEQQPTPEIKEEKTAGKRGRKSFKEMDAESDLTEVPEDEILFSKQYYSISQVAQWFKVNNSLIRYWENEFDVLKPRKNRKGDRLFRPEDVKNLQLIYHLLRTRKFTIEGAKEYLKANKAKADANMQLVQSLTKFKSFLLELRANLGA